MAPEPTPEEVSQFVERFAGILTNSGMPSMSARVMGAMLVSPDGALTAAELAESLKISRAGAALFGADTPVGRRLAEAADFFAFIHADMDQMIKNWRADRSR
ncbi:hypothetical protein [Kribbella sp. NPDC055071]